MFSLSSILHLAYFSSLIIYYAFVPPSSPSSRVWSNIFFVSECGDEDSTSHRLFHLSGLRQLAILCRVSGSTLPILPWTLFGRSVRSRQYTAPSGLSNRIMVNRDSVIFVHDSFGALLWDRIQEPDFKPTLPSCACLEHLGLPSAVFDMRYSQDSAIDTQSPSSLVNLYPPPIPRSALDTSHYTHDTSSFFSSAPSHLIAPEARPRLRPSNSIPSGMAHLHRSPALPNYSTPISTREQYAPATPTYRRPAEHSLSNRSPSFSSSNLRRAISETPSPTTSFSHPSRMDGGRVHPPLDCISMLGRLEYVDGNSTPIVCEIDGIIDKGFFLSDGDWTCYRRNYFTCQCSFSLTPNFHPNVPIQFVCQSDNNAYPVISFAMSISAVVAEDTENFQMIELVQHTPKRDKGPTIRPEKIRMCPKTDQASLHPLAPYPGSEPGLNGPSRGLYSHAPMYAAARGHPGPPSNHSFERIQFKQATANNGKRRAAQQYYNLLVELWAECGASPDSWLKIAYKRSAKVIVRGRSPGHYQIDRRSSGGSGQGVSGITLAGTFPTGALVSPNYATTSSNMMSNNYSSYDGRLGGTSGAYGASAMRHQMHDLPPETIIPPDGAKAIDTVKEYHYYPATIYEGHHDGRQSIDMFAHSYDSLNAKVKHELKSDSDASAGPGLALPLPSLNLYTPGSLMTSRRCGQFDGKPISGGYYPILPQQNGMNNPSHN